MTSSPRHPDPTTAVRFVFFREDGRTFGIADDPTREDFEHARVGLHVILRLTDLRLFDRRGEWNEIASGVLPLPDADAASAPYHVPESFAG